MNILIIGGTGFIGQHLCRALAKDHNIFVFARHSPLNRSAFPTGDGGSLILGDITQSYSINNACNKIDCIVYLASSVIPATSNFDPIFDIQSNLIGAVNTLNAAINNKVRRFIFLSSGGTVYGSGTRNNFKETDPEMPLCSYGITKLATEKYIHMFHKLHGLSYSILRLSNPYGPGHLLDKPQGVIGFFIDRILQEEPLEIWGDGTIERDFIYIQDAINAITRAIFADSTAQLLNIGSGVSTSINELIDIIGSETAKKPKLRYMASRPFDIQRSVLDITAAQEILGWTPNTRLREGIRLTMEDRLTMQ